MTNEGTDVDEEIEVLRDRLNALIGMEVTDGYHVDTGGSKSRVNDDLLPGLGIPNEELCFFVLFGDQGRDSGLEAASAETHDNDGDNEAGERSIGVFNDTRDGRDDEEDMTEECDCY